MTKMNNKKIKPSIRGFQHYCQSVEQFALLRAVKKQLGHDGQDFLDDLENVLACSCGANGGFNGFIYYGETEDFFYEYRDLILKLADQEADDFGIDVIEMVRNFNCLGKQYYSVKDVSLTLYGNREQGNQQVADAMAKYALEEVANMYDHYKSEL